MTRARRPRTRRRRPPPQGIDERTNPTGLRAVAIFEAVKGVVVLALGLGLLALIRHDVEDAAENLLVFLHINPERRLAEAFLNAASKMTDARLWAFAGAALVYATVRFIEAWGLWNRRVWAEWFAVLSGALYLPWEIVKLSQKVNWLHLGLFAINLTILLYMIYIRVRACWPPPCKE